MTDSNDIFTFPELHEIIQAFPPEFSHATLNLPPLTVVQGGNALTLSDYVLEQIEGLLRSGSKRLSVVDISSKIEAPAFIVNKALKEVPHLFATDIRQQQHIPLNEVRNILDRLYESSSTNFVKLAEFCNDADVNVESLTRHIRHDDKITTSLWPTRNSVSVTLYCHTRELLLSMKHNVENVLKNAKEPVTWIESDLKGLDEGAFLSLFSASAPPEIEPYKIIFAQSHITFIPRVFRQQKDDALLKSLSDLGWLDLNLVVGSDINTYATTEELKRKLKDTFSDDVAILDGFAVSIPYLAEQIPSLCKLLLDQGFVALGTAFIPDVEIEPLRSAYIEQIIPMLQKQVDGLSIVAVARYLATDVWLSRASDAWIQVIQTQADEDWSAYSAMPDKVSYPAYSLDVTKTQQLSFVSAFRALMKTSRNSLATIPEDLAIAVLEKLNVKTIARIFGDRIKRRDNEADEDFRSGWQFTISYPFYLWKEGLNNITDTKLRHDLSSLLARHMCDDYLRNNINKLKPCGRTTRTAMNELFRCLEKLKSSTNSENLLEGIEELIQSSNAKMSCTSYDAEQLVERRKLELEKLASSIDGTESSHGADGGRLLLATLIWLLAKHQTGVIYATGRFVPRLLKLLKGRINDTQYQQLQEIKEEAKIGRFSADSQQILREMLN